MKLIYKLFFTTLTFSLSFHFCKAQSVGYQGKRFSVNWNFGVSPALIFPNAKEKKTVNTTFGLSADMAMFKQGSLGVHWNTYKTGTIELPDIQQGYSNGIYQYYAQTRFLPLSVREFDVYYRFFFKNPPPLGIFFSFSLGQQVITPMEDISYKTDNPNASDPMLTLSFPEGVRATYFGIEHGMNRVLTKKLLFKYSLSCRINGIYSEKPYSSPHETDGAVERNFKRRVGYHSLLRFEAGLGYLIF